MANGNGNGNQMGTTRDSLDSGFAELRTRMTTMERDHKDLVNTVAQLSRDISSQFNALASDLKTLGRPQYQLLITIGSFGLAVIIAVGSLWGGNMQQRFADEQVAQMRTESRLSRKIEEDPKEYATTREFERLRSGTMEAVRDIRSALVSRAEHDRQIAAARADLDAKWDSFKVQHSDLKEQIKGNFDNQQRQIDDINKRTSVTTAETITTMQATQAKFAEKLAEIAALVGRVLKP